MATPVDMPRRGARRPHEVPAAVLEALERGEESANHMEEIALDMGALLANTFPELAGCSEELRQGGLVTRMRNGGRIVLKYFGPDVAEAGSRWSSDTTRGWAAMAVGAMEGIGFAERLS